MSEEKINKFPSTARIVNGKYIPCEINQPYAYQNSGAHEMSDAKHTVLPGYCEAHKVLGCLECSR